MPSRKASPLTSLSADTEPSWLHDCARVFLTLQQTSGCVCSLRAGWMRPQRDGVLFIPPTAPHEALGGGLEAGGAVPKQQPNKIVGLKASRQDGGSSSPYLTVEQGLEKVLVVCSPC